MRTKGYKPVCPTCWNRLHTQFNEETKEKTVSEECVLEVHIKTQVVEQCTCMFHDSFLKEAATPK